MAGFMNSYYPAYDNYGTLTLSDTAQSFSEPVTLSEAKQFLRVDDDDDDALIAGLITTARSQAEVYQQRVLVRKQFDLTYDTWPGYRVELASPVVSVDLVQYTDDAGTVHQLVSGTDYLADLHKQPAILACSWNLPFSSSTLTQSSSILIRFTAGYLPTDPFWSNAGARLKTGMLLLISHLYTNRLPIVAGTSGELPFGITAFLSAGSLRRPR